MRKDSLSVRLSWPGKAAPRRVRGVELEPRRAGDARYQLLCGENLAALSSLAERASRYTLAYLDPPFFTGREHTHVERRRGPSGTIVRTEMKGFDDRWHSIEEYLAVLADRIAAARDLLSDDGCLVLHVDPKTSHYAKVLCDEIFGSQAFASEIVWRYRRWPSKTRNFQRVHDVLLRYVKDPQKTPRFHQLYEPLAASTRATWGDRKQRAVVDDSGRRCRSSTTPDRTPGAPLGDVWEIGILAPVAKERTGYPTQKPEALLERLIEACTEPGDAVLDPYLGSGTTLAVAARLGRIGTGIDENRRAIQLARKRLNDLGITASEHTVIERDDVSAVEPVHTRPRVA